MRPSAISVKFSELLPSYQALVRLCQSIDYGQITGLHIRNGEPVFDPQPVVLLDIKLDADSNGRREANLDEFALRDEVRRLLHQIETIGNGIVERISRGGHSPTAPRAGRAYGGPGVNSQMEAYVIEQATLRAGLLSLTARFLPQEIEDARQELLLDCLRRSTKFDSTRGDWPGFVRGVMRNQATVLVTRRGRRVRREVLAADLARPDHEDHGEPLDAVGGATPLDDPSISVDVRRVLAGLPDHLRSLADLLPQMAITEICVVTGKSRSRVYQMIGELRMAFIEAGLGPRGGRG